MKQLHRLCMIALLFGIGSAYAEPPNDGDALKRVEAGKVVFDMNTADAEKTTLDLMVLGETVHDFVRQGVEPAEILAFRGPSAKLISKDREQANGRIKFEPLQRMESNAAWSVEIHGPCRLSTARPAPHPGRQ